MSIRAAAVAMRDAIDRGQALMEVARLDPDPTMAVLAASLPVTPLNELQVVWVASWLAGEGFTSEAALRARLDEMTRANREHIDKVDELQSEIDRLTEQVSLFREAEHEYTRQVVAAELRAEAAEQRLQEMEDKK